jgi:hypothetical protein
VRANAENAATTLPSARSSAPLGSGTHGSRSVTLLRKSVIQQAAPAPQRGSARPLAHCASVCQKGVAARNAADAATGVPSVCSSARRQEARAVALLRKSVTQPAALAPRRACARPRAPCASARQRDVAARNADDRATGVQPVCSSVDRQKARVVTLLRKSVTQPAALAPRRGSARPRTPLRPGSSDRARTAQRGRRGHRVLLRGVPSPVVCAGKRAAVCAEAKERVRWWRPAADPGDRPVRLRGGPPERRGGRELGRSSDGCRSKARRGAGELRGAGVRVCYAFAQKRNSTARVAGGTGGGAA